MSEFQQKKQLPSMYKMMYDFSRYLSEDLREAIRKNNIGVTHKLRNSISFTLRRNGNEVSSIILKYNDYGKFVDMGVGRGMPLGSRKQLGASFFKKRNEKGQLLRHMRKPNPWYSKTIYRQNVRLGDMLEEYYGITSTNIIKENLPTTITLQM
ncbi:MAG: hypothetical protein A3F72_02860 [Bacteroidetes bacterium RIFCSPLOWO2_12_FULL_35_15]|nr:MAG: hypothetical protein A3F72_02860 [Bacteroidetes bacterium RIFCSPLOWO2_12_FULL_35_15]